MTITDKKSPYRSKFVIFEQVTDSHVDALFTQVRHHLSKLGTNNKIKSERAGSGLKEGNWYSIK